MAEVVLSAFVGVLFDKLASPILEEYELWSGAKKQLEKLESTLSTIESVLDDAEERQVKDKAVRNWLAKLKDAVYDADNLLDEFATEGLRRRVENEKLMRNQVRNFFSLSNPLAFHLKLGLKTKDINERLNAIASERINFHLREGVFNTQPENGERQQTHSFIIESEIFGREKDKAEIVDLLIGSGVHEEASVVPIVGMGGLGKTTLAQLAYNDVRVQEHFKLRMWVCVSEDFDVRKLTKAIIESATRSKCDILDMDLQQSRLREKLGGERFLLILDDVWSEDYEKWDRLRILLRGGAEGSKIIVTTRSEEVASIMGTLPTHYLARLSEDDCWSLFKKRAFGTRGAEETPNMVAIGREIVKKCGGVPLAIKSLGSLMHSKREEHEWLFVRDNEIWKLPQETEGILPALRLSYNHLPSYLKQCFAYCSIFPKDYEITKEKLIQLWIAEGFIRPCEGNRNLEDVGSDCFNYLLWRSFFQDVEKDDDGNIVACKIHDLMHDLAQFVAGTECSIVQADDKRQSILKRTRHSSLICNRRVSTIRKSFYEGKNLHTFLLLVERPEAVEVPRNIFSSFRYLRALDLSRINIKTLPNSIGKLKHLRFLDLSHTDVEILPKSINTLWNLQTLKLSHCTELRELPKYMRNLISLRHLNIDRCRSLSCMPIRIGKLTCLQTLSKFIVGKEFGCRLGELKGLNLRGELTIENLENVRYARDAREANLKAKHNLWLLELSWKRDYYNSGEESENVLEGLEPHPNLKTLRLKRYMGLKFPKWLMSSLLSKLVEISLKDCKRCEQLPPLGQLRFLKFLSIKGMDAVKNVGSEFYGHGAVSGFPSLKQLEFHDMLNLEEWSSSGGTLVLPSICKLVIKGCPKLTTMPHQLLSLEELELTDSNEMLLRSVANLTSLFTLRICEFSEVRSLHREVETLVALKTLHIETFDELVSLPESLTNLTRLESLGVWGCSSLMSLPELQGLISLRELSILNCINLTSLVEGLQNLTTLEKLSIEGCPELASLPEEGMRHLTALRTLRISHCPKLVSLPEGLQHITALKDLHINGFPSTVALPEWLGNLTSLRELSIWDCPNLMSLPVGMQCLSSLEYLSIWQCPYLEQRCEREIGEDWYKIAHIPEIHVKDQEIVIEGSTEPEIERNEGWRCLFDKLKRINIVKPWTGWMLSSTHC